MMINTWVIKRNILFEQMFKIDGFISELDWRILTFDLTFEFLNFK